MANDGSIIFDVELNYEKAKGELQNFGKETERAGKSLEQGIEKSADKSRAALSKLSDAQKQLNSLYKSGDIDKGQYEKLSKQITDATNSLKDNSKQLQAAERDYGKSQSNVQQYTDKLGQLDAQLTAIQQKTVEEYGLAEYFKYDDEGLERFLSGMMDTNAEFQKLQKEASVVEEKLNAYKKGMEHAGQETHKFKEHGSAAARAANELAAEVQNAADKSSGAAKGGITSLQIAFGDLISKGIQLALKAIKDFISDGIELAANLEVVEDRINDIFGEKGAAKIDVWAESAIDSFGLAEANAKSYAAALGDLAQGMNLSSAKTKELSMNTTELVGRLADLKGAKTEDVFKAMESALVGNGEALKKYGIIVNEHTLKEYALSKGMSRTVSGMTEAEKMWLRYQYIMEKGTEKLGDAQVGSEKYNSQLNRTRQIMADLSTQFAQKFLPALTKTLSETNDYLQEHGDTLTNLGTIVAYIANAFMLLIKTISALPPEIVIMVGILLTAVKAFTSVSTGLGKFSEGMKLAGGAGLDSFLIKVLALTAALSILLFLILAIKDGTDKAASGMNQMAQATSEAQRQAQSQVNGIQRSQGRATGIAHAPPGWQRVGERGEEWMYIPGGATVLNASTVASLKLGAQSFGGGSLLSGGNSSSTTNHYSYDQRKVSLNMPEHMWNQLVGLVNTNNNARIRGRARGN